MKHLNLLLLTVLVFCNSHCFAEWRTFPNLEGKTPKEGLDTYFNEIDKEFLLPSIKAKNGFRIAAIDGNFSSFVSLRYIENRVDFQVSFFQQLYEEPGNVYLQLLDEDKFLIESVFVERIAKEFKGDLLGHFNMNWDTFCKVKYYNIILKI